LENPELYASTIAILHYARGIANAVLAGQANSKDEREKHLVMA
jgi:hypothetical protein